MDMFSNVGTDVEIFERNLENKGLIDNTGADMSKGNSVQTIPEILDTLNLSRNTFKTPNSGK